MQFLLPRSWPHLGAEAPERHHLCIAYAARVAVLPAIGQLRVGMQHSLSSRGGVRARCAVHRISALWV